MEFKDYYAILGIPRTAGEAEIRKAFRKLAREHHPDVAKDKKASEEKFKEINEAHEVLSDPAKREQYDRLGAGWDQPAADPGFARRHTADPGAGAQEFHFEGTGFSDFFERFFGGGGAQRRYGFPHGDDEFAATTGGPPRAVDGHDIEGDILVTLHEAMHGTMRPISLQVVDPRTGQAETQSFTVRIPAGASEGRRIRVPGQGAPGRNGGASGDLFLRIRLAAHPDFRARGADLHRDLDLAPWEAVLGAEVTIAGLDGDRMKLKVPPGSGDGRQLRLRGRGLPKAGTGERGDLYVDLHIAIPENPSDSERELWEKLAATSTFRPRQEP